MVAPVIASAAQKAAQEATNKATELQRKSTNNGRQDELNKETRSNNPETEKTKIDVVTLSQKLKAVGINDKNAEEFSSKLNKKVSGDFSKLVDGCRANESVMKRLQTELNSLGPIESSNAVNSILEQTKSSNNDTNGVLNNKSALETLEDVIKELGKLRKEKERKLSEESFSEKGASLNQRQLAEYNGLTEQIKNGLSSKKDKELFATIQKRWNGQTQESLSIMRELAKLQDKESIHSSLRSLHTQIFSDILKTVANPNKLNQGIYSTCVPSSFITDGIQDGYTSKILEITRKELHSARCGAFKDTGNGTYLHDSLNTDMVGGVMAAALVSHTHEGGFNEKGETIYSKGNLKGKAIQGITDEGMARIFKAIYGIDGIVINGEEFKKLNSDPTLLKELIRINNGITVKVRWDEAGQHAFHMVRISGFYEKNGVTYFKLDNSQSESLLNEYGKAKVESMSANELLGRISMAFVENNKETLELLKKFNIESIGTDEIEDNLEEIEKEKEQQRPDESPKRSNDSNQDEDNSSDLTSDEGLESLQTKLDPIVRINKPNQVEDEERNIMTAPKDGTGIGVEFSARFLCA